MIREAGSPGHPPVKQVVDKVADPLIARGQWLWARVKSLLPIGFLLYLTDHLPQYLWLLVAAILANILVSLFKALKVFNSEFLANLLGYPARLCLTLWVFLVPVCFALKYGNEYEFRHTPYCYVMAFLGPAPNGLFRLQFSVVNETDLGLKQVAFTFWDLDDTDPSHIYTVVEPIIYPTIELPGGLGRNAFPQPIQFFLDPPRKAHYQIMIHCETGELYEEDFQVLPPPRGEEYVVTRVSDGKRMPTNVKIAH